MSIFDIFRGTGSVQPQQDSFSQTPPGQMTPQGTTAPGTLPNGETSALAAKPIDPSAPPPAGIPATDNSPLADFSTLWDTGASSGANQMPSLNADPAKISEAARKIDFSKAVNPQLAQKAMSGDIDAFMQVMNQVAQQTFAVATQASTHLVDRHTAAVREHMQGELPNQLRRFQATDGLLSENPKLSHPAIQPLISVIQQQFANQFPQATTAELKAHALKYLSGVMQTIGPDGLPTSGAGPSGGSGTKRQQDLQAQNLFDWGNWAEAQNQTPFQ